MPSQELLNKVKLFRDGAAFRKPEHTPHLSNVFTWKIYDSSVSFSEAMHDFKKMEKAVREFIQRYDFDAYVDVGTRNPVGISEALGTENSCYTVDEETGAINVIDKVLFDGSEYETFCKDPNAFYRLLFQRKYPNATAKEVQIAMQSFMDFGQYIQRIEKIINEEYNRPLLTSMSSAILMPIETFNHYGRGIKGIAIDMRRHADGLKAANDKIFETETLPMIKAVLATDTSIYAADCYTAMLAYLSMNTKQFGEFYWPYLKQYIDACKEAEKTLFMYCESTMLRFTDFFASYDKGLLILHPELDSVYDVRKTLPNIAVSGGESCVTLGLGTPEECIDEAKRLINEMGPGFILSQDKMVSFKNDCNRENLLALCDFAKNYRI